MFEFLKYKQRLQNVRTELIAILESLQPLERLSRPITLIETQADKVVLHELTRLDCEIGTIAKAISDVCRILVRVIDSLPG